MQRPDVASDLVAVLRLEYVVAAVVVIVAVDPLGVVILIACPVTAVTVPIEPPNRAWPMPPEGGPPLVDGPDPSGVAYPPPGGTPCGAPLGGVPLLPAPGPPLVMVRAAHAEPLLIVTLVAVTSVAPTSPLLLAAVTQSPTFASDRVAALTLLNRVALPNATSRLPLEVVTATPALPADAMVPVTEAIGKARSDDAVELPAPLAALVAPLDPEPQPASRIAVAARTTGPVARRWTAEAADMGLS
jgi:hypothetical protein